MMKFLDEELEGICTPGDDDMLYPDMVIGDIDPRPNGRRGRMYM